VRPIPALLLGALIWNAPCAQADEGCPDATSEIDTDRPDVTNSSAVVPLGSLQAENGINLTGRPEGTTFDGTNTRLRLGVLRCAEILVDVPNYYRPVSGNGPRGTSDIVPAAKMELEGVPPGAQASVTAGLGLPTGAYNVSGRFYNPYLQMPWSQEVTEDWSLHGMLTHTWIPGGINNRVLETTLSVERDLGPQVDIFIEYVGDYPNHDVASQVLNCGGAYRFTPLQQIDFHAGLGFTHQSPAAFIGFGYSIRFDGLF
jgi:hypothetical protein